MAQAFGDSGLCEAQGEKGPAKGRQNSRLVGLREQTTLYIPWGYLYLLTLFYKHRLGHLVGQRTLENFQEEKRGNEFGKLTWWPIGSYCVAYLDHRKNV